MKSNSVSQLFSTALFRRTIGVITLLGASCLAGQSDVFASDISAGADSKLAAASQGNMYALRVQIVCDRSQFDNCFNGNEQIDALLKEAVKSVHEMVVRRGALKNMRLTLPLSLNQGSSRFSFGAGRMFGRTEKNRESEKNQESTDSSKAADEAVLTGRQAMSLSPLIIDVSMGDSKFSDSFNAAEGEAQNGGFFKALAGGGIYDTVQSARPFRLTVGFLHATLCDSLDHKGEVPKTVQQYGQLQSNDFVWSDATPSKRALRLSILLRGCTISHSFNRTAGIVKIADELADSLEKGLSPEELCHIDWISIDSGPVGLEGSKD